jgi:hypothetical protein
MLPECRAKTVIEVYTFHHLTCFDGEIRKLARLKSKLEIGARERSYEFGNQFLDSVTFAPEAMPPKSQSSRVLLPFQ